MSQSTIILFWRRSTKKETNLSFRQTRRERSGLAFPAGLCHATEKLSSLTFRFISEQTRALPPDKEFRGMERREVLAGVVPKILYTFLMIGMMFTGTADGSEPQILISQFTHTSWTAREGVPGPVRVIAQTPDGYLWLGTDAGLYRYDGLRFIAWQPSFGEHLPVSPVWSLCAGRDGSLWIGFSSGGISRLRDGHLTNYSHSDRIPAGGILSIVEDGNGSIWAGGSYRLSRLQSGRWHQVGAELGYSVAGTQTMLVDGDGKLWVATDNLNFHLSKNPLRPNTILALAPNGKIFAATGLAVGMVRMMAAIPGGGVWVVHTSGDSVFVTNEVGSKPEIHITSPRCLLFDNDDSLWIGLSKGGLRRLRDLRNQPKLAPDQFDTIDGLSSSMVYAAFKDREGNLWFGTGGGLDRFQKNKATPFSAKEGLIPGDQIALTSTGDGSVWFASFAGDTVQRLRAGRLVSSKLPAYPRSEPGRILSLYADKKDHVWLGGSFKLAKGDDGKFSYPKVTDVDEVYDVHAVVKDAEGNLWVTVWDDKGGGVLRLRDGKWTNFRNTVRLPQYRCRVLYGDPQGRVWLGFEDGEIAVYEKDEFHVYSSKDGLPEGRVFAITSDRAGQTWIGGEGGLSRFERGHFVTLTKANGLPWNSISGIVEDDDGFLWLAGALAILRVSPRELDKALLSPSYRMQATSFDAADGLRGLPRQREPFPTATRSTDGRLWFSTTAGVAVIDPRHVPKNVVPPPVMLEALKADDQTVNVSSGLRLPPKTKNLQFQYAALSLTAPERVQFRYKLEGYDVDWRGPISARDVTYTNLPPRDYVFSVIACNNDGVWNEAGASLKFTILPAFYQTNLFLLLCVAAIGCLAWVTYWRHVRQVSDRLSLIFKERLAERTRIARELHDTLLQSFQGLLLHFQKARNLLPERAAEAIQTLDRALDGAEQAIVEGRDAIHDLRSSAPAARGLVEEITRIGEELVAKNGNKDAAQFRVVIEGTAQTLNPNVHVEIFRIAREALRNAFSHSQASRIETEVAYSSNLFRLRVRDDGKGMAPDVRDQGERIGHWGLGGMGERAKRLGGKLDVWSEPGAGTEVDLRVPASVAYQSSPSRNNVWLFWKKKKNGHDDHS